MRAALNEDVLLLLLLLLEDTEGGVVGIELVVLVLLEVG